MASGSGVPATPKIPGAFSSHNLISNREPLSLSRSLKHPTLSKTTGSDSQIHTAVIHFFSTLLYCLIQVHAISLSILVTTWVQVLDCFYIKSKLSDQPSSQDQDGVEHSSLESEPREAGDISPREPRHSNDRPDVLSPEEDIGPGGIETIIIDESEDDAERATCSPGEADGELDRGHVDARCVHVIISSDSEDDDDDDSCSLGEADGDVNNQESECQEAEPVHGVEERSKQLSPPPANGHDVAAGQGAKTPISITSEFVLTGKTLVGSGSVNNTLLLPDFNDGFPAPEHKDKQRPHKPPDEVPASDIPKMCSFYNDLGWISRGTLKKRDNGALTKTIERHLTETDNRSGCLYIIKHFHYNNLYKIGITTSAMAKREAEHPPCIRENPSDPYTTGYFTGAPRAESLAKIHMKSRNVPLKLCLRCRVGNPTDSATKKQIDASKRTKFHTEWFTGDFDDIKACVDFWAEIVATFYDDTTAFTGNVDEILATVLSSEGKRRKSRQGSAESKKHLNNSGPSPCAQRTKAERRPSRGSTGPEGDEETGLPDEVGLGDRKQLWERLDRTTANVGATPEKKAARKSNGEGLGVRPEGPWTRSKARKFKMNAVPLNAEDISRMVR